MAAWQCDFHLAPRRALLGAGRSLPEVISPRRARQTLWWRGVSPPANLSTLAAAAAPPAPAWSAQLSTFGTATGDRIDVWHGDGGAVDSVLVRFDLRHPSRSFLGGVVDLARAADALLIRADGLVVPPDPERVREALATSAAARFVADPDSYLRRVRLGGPMDG